MKKIKEIICIAAAMTALGGCSDKKTDVSSSSAEETTTAAVQTTTSETEPAVQTTTAPPKVNVNDFYGKWVSDRIIDGEDVYSDYYGEVPIEYVFSLDISEDGTAVLGTGLPGREAQTYNWEFKGRVIKLSGESDIYGGIKEGHLILTNAEGLKVYMAPAEELLTMEEAKYEAICDIMGEEPVLPELSITASESTSEDYIGKWECSYYEVDGEAFKDELYGVPLGALFQMEIMEDNTAQFRVGGTDEEALVTDYTWEIDESGCLELYEDGELVSVAQIRKGELYVDESVDITHFRSVEEFSDFDWNSLDNQ